MPLICELRCQSEVVVDIVHIYLVNFLGFDLEVIRNSAYCIVRTAGAFKAPIESKAFLDVASNFNKRMGKVPLESYDVGYNPSTPLLRLYISSIFLHRSELNFCRVIYIGVNILPAGTPKTL